MNYQTLKQLRDSLISEIQNRNFQEKKILDVGDYDILVCFLDEYEELTRKMLQHIKQLETRGKEIDDHEDRKWLEYYLSLGE